MSTRITFMTLGDPHFKHQEFYLNRVDDMGEKFIELCKEKQPDFIVNLGDTLHDHRKLDMVAQCKAVKFMRKLKDLAPLYVLIGNHDRINNSEFLTDISPFEAMKEWKNTFIVDDHIATHSNQFFFCPYVPPGRLKEALEINQIQPENFILGFAHQEFKGAKMGAIISEEGDDALSTPVITGHVHDQQMLPNVNYVGTPIGHSHGEHGRKTVSFFTLSIEEIPTLFPYFWCKSKGYFIYEEKIELDVKKLKTLHLDAKEFLNYELKKDEDPRYYRIVITGKDNEVRLAKKSDKYQEFENLGCRIHFPLTKDKKEEGNEERERATNQVKTISYNEAVMEKLKEEKELFQLYQELIQTI